MPGMMDTILNLGLNDVAVEGVAAKTQNPRFAYDSYRRFIQMFSDVVMGIEKSKFEAILDEAKETKGVKLDTELDAEDLKKVVVKYKELYKKEMGVEFPQDAKEQLIEAVKAVFRSWDNPRAIVYRRLNDIPSSWGTAVNVQSMVFGNMGNDCGTGVAFTRDPATGEKRLYGEYLMNAQGEDVVAGRSQSPRCMRPFRKCMISLLKSRRRWKITMRTCRTWSSPSKAASCSCFRPEMVRELRRLPSRSRSTW